MPSLGFLTSTCSHPVQLAHPRDETVQLPMDVAAVADLCEGAKEFELSVKALQREGDISAVQAVRNVLQNDTPVVVVCTRPWWKRQLDLRYAAVTRPRRPRGLLPQSAPVLFASPLRALRN